MYSLCLLYHTDQHTLYNTSKMIRIETLNGLMGYMNLLRATKFKCEKLTIASQ